MSSRPDSGQCGAERTKVDNELSGPRPMSSLAGPGRCRAEHVWADVDNEMSGPIPMSSPAGSG